MLNTRAAFNMCYFRILVAKRHKVFGMCMLRHIFVRYILNMFTHEMPRFTCVCKKYGCHAFIKTSYNFKWRLARPESVLHVNLICVIPLECFGLCN